MLMQKLASSDACQRVKPPTCWILACRMASACSFVTSPEPAVSGAAGAVHETAVGSSSVDCVMSVCIVAKQVALVAPRRWQPAAGAELAISYGDKSNEELLFHYGAVPVYHSLAASFWL